LKNTDRGAWVFESATGIARRTVRRESHTEIETCARCHSRRTLLAEDYVHGAPLLDTHRLTLLEENLYHADGQILGEVYVYGSFIQSKMYREGVTCGDCHDPHSLELHGTVQTVCGRCHLPARFDSPAHHGHTPGKPGARCIDCHMPKRTYMVVDPRGDHSFRVPRPDLTAELGTPNACNGCHEDMSAERAADEVARLHGPVRSPHYAGALHAGRMGLPGSEDLLRALAADADQPGLARATALHMLGRFRRDVAGPELRRALVERDPLVRLGALAAAEGVVPSALVPLVSPVLDDPVRSVRIEAARLLSSVRGSLPPERRARLDLVLAEYERAQVQSADRPEGHLNLGLLYLALGHPERAEAEYELAIARQATFLPAYVNLADLYRAQGREADGERVLRQALAIEPPNAEVHHALGLLLVRRRRLDEALTFLESATRMRPEALRYAYVYGVGLHSAGRNDAALVVLEAAHARHPADRDLLAALASIHLDAGSIDPALVFARELERLSPDDPSIADLVRRLEAVPR
jgi:tetratricopeptide (TPR) repeat protein